MSAMGGSTSRSALHISEDNNKLSSSCIADTKFLLRMTILCFAVLFLISGWLEHIPLNAAMIPIAVQPIKRNNVSLLRCPETNVSLILENVRTFRGRLHCTRLRSICNHFVEYTCRNLRLCQGVFVSNANGCKGEDIFVFVSFALKFC